MCFWHLLSTAPEVGMVYVKGSRIGHVVAPSWVLAGAGRGIWQSQDSWHCPGGMLVQPHLSSLLPIGAAEKPGTCPVEAPEGLFFPCSFPCLEDRDCLGAQKCCQLHCGSACLEPLQGKASTWHWDSLSSLQSPSLLQTPATSLPPRGGCMPGPLTQLCLARETQCWDMAAGAGHVPRGGQGNGMGTLQPHTHCALPDQPKPEESPAAKPGSAGPCQERCQRDSNCPDTQKCSNSSQSLLPAPAGETGQDGHHGQGHGAGTRRCHEATASRTQSCGTTGASSPRTCQGGLWWAGKATLQQGLHATLTSSLPALPCSMAQGTPALPLPPHSHTSSRDATRTRTVPHPRCAVTSGAVGSATHEAKVRELAALPTLVSTAVPGVVLWELWAWGLQWAVGTYPS